MREPIITYRRRWVFIFLTYFYVFLTYLISNHFDFVGSHHLPLNYIDIRTPFLPWTGWIYVMVYVLPLMVGVFVENDEDIRRVVFSFCLMATLCTLVFIFYPTVYPRPHLPDTGWASFPLIMVRRLDTAKNCFPSQHVAGAFLSALFVCRLRPRWGVFAILLAVLISISTLTTKQHYVWDVIVGYVMARVIYRISIRN